MAKVYEYDDYVEYEGSKQGVCPICGCDDVEYQDNAIDGNEVHFYFVCPKCGNAGSETHIMYFECMTAIKDKE